MKTLIASILLAGVLCAAPSILRAGEGHGHSHEQVGGPKGGRLLENTQPRAEFFVEADKTATITFYDEAMKAVAPAGQTAVLIVDTNGKKTTLNFEEKGGVLASKGPVPEGESNAVLQLKQAGAEKPRNFRFVLNNAVCPHCNRAEYSCICGH